MSLSSSFSSALLLRLLQLFVIFSLCYLINSDSVCTPYDCCDRLSNCSDIALSKQCKQHDYDCQLSCGTCNATERGGYAYEIMWKKKKTDCSNGYIGKSWDGFERATSSKIKTPNDVPYFPGYCLYDMKVDWEVPKNCSQLEHWNKYFKGKLKFLHLYTYMHINTSCDTTPDFFKSVEIIMGENSYNDNAECIVQINDMLGNRTIFDFFPNLKFVGLEYPKQLSGPIICGNTIDEKRLSEEQKDRINRIDQGHLWDFWQFRVDAVPPTGNSSSYSVCTPYDCCDRLSNCSDIALNKQCKLHDYDCQLSCGTCNATERGWVEYNGMWKKKKADCSNGWRVGISWDSFERVTSSEIWTPNNVPYFPGYCLYGMELDWEVPKDCNQLDHWNKYFNGKLRFLHLWTHMHINTSCDTIPEFFKSVEIIMGEGINFVRDKNTKCIVQINDMTGNRTIFDFFPNLKFVGLERPHQLTGPLICGNTIDEARLTNEQKDRINRIDQGRLWDFWQFRVDAVPPTGNSSSYSVCTPYDCCDRLSNCSDIALSKQCKQHDYDCQLSCGTCNATKRGFWAYNNMLKNNKPDCSNGYSIGKSWYGFERATSSEIWTPNNVPYFPGYCLYGMEFNWEVPKKCSQLEHWNKYFNGKLKFLHLYTYMHINTSCGTIPEFFKSIEIITGQGETEFWNGIRYNRKCTVQINDMSGSRTIFDFFPNLKFVGLERPHQLDGSLICGNTIDEARLTEEQKIRINRIDQGRLLEFGKLLNIAAPPTGNSSFPPNLKGGIVEDIELIEGEELILNCENEGDPTPEIEWKKVDNGGIPPRAQMLFDNSVMVLNEVKESEGGVFSCTLSNKVGVAEKTFNVKVIAKPHIDKDAMDIHSNTTLPNIKSLSVNDMQSSNIPSHNGNETVLTTPNHPQDGKVLFYLAYGEPPNFEGRIYLFNSNTFEVEIVGKFSTFVNPCGVATGNDKIFLIRGDYKVFKIFNYEMKQLTESPDPPEWRANATVAYYKNKLYYIGGGWNSNTRPSSCVNILVNGTWQRGPDFPIKVKYARHSICNDKLYIISLYAMFQLSDDEREWIEVGKMEMRWNPAVASLNGKIYITGGYKGYDALNSCLCFDPSQPSDRRFTTIANMNYKRYQHSLVVANGKLYAIGGHQNRYTEDDKFCKSVEEYDPATDSWRIIGKLE